MFFPPPSGTPEPPLPRPKPHAGRGSSESRSTAPRFGTAIPTHSRPTQIISGPTNWDRVTIARVTLRKWRFFQPILAALRKSYVSSRELPKQYAPNAGLVPGRCPRHVRHTRRAHDTPLSDRCHQGASHRPRFAFLVSTSNGTADAFEEGRVTFVSNTPTPVRLFHMCSMQIQIRSTISAGRRRYGPCPWPIF